MDQNPQFPQQNPPAGGSVSFPSQKPPKKDKKKRLIWIIIVIIVLVLLAGGWFVLSDSQEEIEPAPTPFVESATDFNDFDEFEEPPIEEEEVDKDEITIEVLNGTGVAGEASFLQGKLANLDYSDIEVGNADSQDNDATIVTFASSLPESVKEEIEDTLNSVYDDVTVKTSGSSEGIQIITGLRKGQTPKPAATSTPEETGTPEPTSSPTPESTGQ